MPRTTPSIPSPAISTSFSEVGDNPATSEAELDEDAVNVLTVHKAKGLEFGMVFLVSLIEDRFPGRERRERIPVPDGDPQGEPAGQGELPAGGTAALLRGDDQGPPGPSIMTWARDYGLKRLKKVSPFVLEALDIPKMPEEVLRSLGPRRDPPLRPGRGAAGDAGAPSRPGGTLTLSFVRVEDYLVCPLKYRFRHDHARARPAPPHPRLRPRPSRVDPRLSEEAG